jgi:hypothetical protein
MTKRTQLIISNPCHEQWDSMEPRLEGRFCGSCQKTVVDFTTMNDQELLDWFGRGRSNICGRMNEDQLNRDLLPRKTLKKRRWAIWWQFLLAGLLVSSDASSQVKPPSPLASQAKKRTGSRPLAMGDTSALWPDQLLRIIDSATQKPVIGASVQLDDDPKFFMADSAGLIVLPHHRIARASALKITSIGYERAVIAVEDGWDGSEKQVRLVAKAVNLQPVVVYANQTETRLMGGLVSVVSIKRTLADTIKNTLLCRKNPITLYPNPVVKGASVTLELRMDKPGNFIAQLYSGTGAVIESIRMEGVNGPKTELLNIPGTLAAGIYFLRVINTETGSMFTEKLAVL